MRLLNRRGSIHQQHLRLNENQATEFILTLPENISGETTIRIEAQTTDALELQTSVATTTAGFLLDSYAPVVTTTSPLVDSYLNVNSNRTVTLNLFDAAGFDEGSIQCYVWLEGVHDANTDGFSDLTERILVDHEVMKIDAAWQFTVYLDETGNAEGDLVNVFLDGIDRDGREIPTDGSGQGHLYWTSRLPTKSTIVSRR